ncbi:hypothetical protein HHL22_20730 [Hymenobacter sp. RP-2-7]|uniref:Uncharacterized protein n=1 Tax=Hymenobacter polaris TaxID=2682546 RepID=A0A7Y0FPP9_9BACT|nr:hypothetical protein [Hymenobacter polaris]NML67634.1 hypothetical protein [Hymenobacter polaris]
MLVLAYLLVALIWLCRLVFGLLACLAIWNGLRLEIGKPGERAHFVLELYSAKRLFN